MLPPAHINVSGNLAAERKVVEPFHVHDHALAGFEHDIGLDGTGPAGRPLHGIAGTVVGHHQKMIATVFCHRRSQRSMAARIFGAGKSRILLLHHRLQAGFEIQRVTGHSAHKNS